MLRKIINTKEDPTLVLDLPKNLRGRRIEILAFAIDEDAISDKKIPAGTFAGTLSHSDADELRKHIEQSRNEWSDPFTNK